MVNYQKPMHLRDSTAESLGDSMQEVTTGVSETYGISILVGDSGKRTMSTSSKKSDRMPSSHFQSETDKGVAKCQLDIAFDGLIF